MPRLEVSKILDGNVPHDKKPEEHFIYVFESLGKYIQENAERLAKSTAPLTHSVKIVAEINANELVTLSITANELVEGK